MRSKLEELVAVLGLQNNVQFDGFFVDEIDVFSRMKACRIAVLPSSREGFGMTLVQSWACGLPVVVCRGRDNAMVDMIDGPFLGRVAEPTPGAIAMSICELLKDTDADRTLRIEFARKHYDSELMVNAVARVLWQAKYPTRRAF
jgi:glycosyltransferase involved in cell wall biosynthesis